MNKKNISQKKILKLIEDICKLEPIEFFGLAKIMGIPTCNDLDEPRDFWEILDDLVEKYYSKGRTYRKNINKILKSAIKDDNSNILQLCEKRIKEKIYGSTTKNSNGETV